MTSMFLPKEKNINVCLTDTLKSDYSNRIFQPCYIPSISGQGMVRTRLYLGDGNSFMTRYREVPGGYFLKLDNSYNDNKKVEKLFGTLKSGAVVFISK